MLEVKATIVKNEALAPNVYGMTFATPEEICVRAGQFVMIGVKGFPLRRPIAICTAYGKEITICYQLKGSGTHTLAEMKAGDEVNVLLPLGNGFFVAEEEQKVALVGGGVGVFPLISVLGAYKNKEINAYMGFRTKSAVCMREEMAKANLTIATDDGSEGFFGNAVSALLADMEKGYVPDVILSCGPLPMLRALKNAMEGKGTPTYVSLEERMGCGIGACLVCVCDRTNGKHARVCKDGPVFEIGEVVL